MGQAIIEREPDAMAERKLKTAIQTQGHTRALKDGSVKPTSFAFEFEEVPAII
jgi:4,5-dihydroxyphthalate decarboxylase